MAGTLVISTLSDGTNSTSSTNCIQGSAKAWVTFNGSGGAISASYNVSSITVSSTGNYLVNFTNALADANYTCVGGGYWYAIAGFTAGGATKTTTQCGLTSRDSNTTPQNANNLCFAAFR